MNWPLSRGATRTLVKAAFGLTLVALLLLRLDVHQVLAALGRFSLPHVTIALALFAASWPVAAWRWRLFAPGIAFRQLLGLTLVGQFYAIVLPGQIAGEAVKAYRVAKGSADAERLAASVAMDRVIGTLTLLIVACAGMVATPHALPLVLRELFGILVVLFVAAIFMFNIPLIHTVAERSIVLLARMPRLQAAAPSLRRAILAWQDFARAPWRLGMSLLCGIALQFVAIAMYAVLAIDLGIDLPIADWAWIVGVSSVAMLLPVSVGGIGLREGSLIGCLGYLGIAGEKAIALSLVVFAVTLSGAIVGAITELTGAYKMKEA
jgi:uncharacterized protein (TIRG00374 family)